MYWKEGKARERVVNGVIFLSIMFGVGDDGATCKMVYYRLGFLEIDFVMDVVVLMVLWGCF